MHLPILRLDRLNIFGLLPLLIFMLVIPIGAQPERPEEKVKALFLQWDKPDSPGCALAIIRDGRIIYKRGYGMADLERRAAISPSSVFYIASVSKQFTAMSISLLAKKGKLSLDDDIRKHLPRFPHYQSPVTIRHLLYQTGGVRDYSHLMSAAGIKFQDAADEDVFRILTRQKELNFRPGDEYLYSNSNYFLLAQIVRAASGKPLREFAAENIFKPLGMARTAFQNDNAPATAVTAGIKDRATGYASRSDGGFVVEAPGSYHIGDGGLFTTVEDLALWDRNFYDNKLGGGPPLIERFQTPGRLNNGNKTGYAFGLEVETYKGLKMFGHDGAYYGYSAAMIRFPEQKFSVVCLCNQSGIGSATLARQVADIYLANEFRQTGNKVALPALKIIEVPEKELTAVAGSYFHSANNNFRRIYVKNGKLIYSRGSSESELAPLGNNNFLMLGTPDRVEIGFRSPRPGAPLQMITTINGEVALVHYPVTPANYTASQLAEFNGDYYSSEIDATYNINLRGEQLALQRKNVDGETPLQAQFADAFFAPGTGNFRFIRDGQNRVTGFMLNTGRVRNLRFDKR